jgi:hypothetical protein
MVNVISIFIGLEATQTYLAFGGIYIFCSLKWLPSKHSVVTPHFLFTMCSTKRHHSMSWKDFLCCVQLWWYYTTIKKFHSQCVFRQFWCPLGYSFYDKHFSHCYWFSYLILKIFKDMHIFFTLLTNFKLCDKDWKNFAPLNNWLWIVSKQWYPKIHWQWSRFIPFFIDVASSWLMSIVGGELIFLPLLLPL